jgi:hypothetical protein
VRPISASGRAPAAPPVNKRHFGIRLLLLYCVRVITNQAGRFPRMKKKMQMLNRRKKLRRQRRPLDHYGAGVAGSTAT